MYLRMAVARVTIADKYIFTTSDGILLSADVVEAEQERASSCTITLYDPGLLLLNLFLTQFQYDGGIAVPTGLLDTTSSSSSSSLTNGNYEGYLKQIEAKFGNSDTSGLTDQGKTALTALSNSNVVGFLCAIAIAELGSPYGEPFKGYGKLFGDSGSTETFDPKTLTDHPKQRRSSGGLTSSATGRYQFLDTTWAGLKTKLGLKDFKPVSQEIGAVGLLMDGGILDTISSGNFEQALTGAGKIWASIEGNPYGQGTATGKKTVLIANVQKYKSIFTSTALNTLLDLTKPTATANATATASATTAATTTTTTSTNASIATPTTTTTTPTGIDVSQGISLRVELAFNDKPEPRAYDFIFTGVNGSNDGPNIITISGKQARAIISKSSKKIFKVYKNTTIRQLTAGIAAKVGASAIVDDVPETNKVYTTIQQSENDYQLLLKLAQKAGLFLRGDSKSLKIETLKSDAQKFTIKRSAFLRGSTWGDQASSDRVLRGEQRLAGVPPVVATANPKGGTVSSGGGTSLNTLIASAGGSSTSFPSGGAATTTGTGRGIVSFGGVFTPAVCAFANLIAWKEVPDSMSLTSYYANNGVSGSVGYFNDADIAAGAGFPKSAGSSFNVGRYQFNRDDWWSAKAVYTAIKGYSPAEQDLIYFWKMNYRKALQPLLAGDIALAIACANKEWASLPGSPYGQVQAGYTVNDAIAYYNEQLKLFGASVPSSTIITTPTTSDTLSSISVAKTISGGLQPITSAADESQGIGKGFEGTWLVNAIAMPDILDAAPGAIAKLDKDTGYGDALIREYRISEVRHSYKKEGLLTTLSIYLPVAVTIKTQSTGVASGSPGVISSGGSESSWSADLQASPQKGDVVAGFPVTSPFGKRVSPGGVGSTDHQGCDIGCPTGTPVFLIGLPTESITVRYIPNNGGAGNELNYIRGKWKFRNLHLHGAKTSALFGGATTKTFQAGQIIGYTNNTGSSTGDHLHFEQRDNNDKPVPPHKGFILWCLTGKSP